MTNPAPNSLPPVDECIIASFDICETQTSFCIGTPAIASAPGQKPFDVHLDLDGDINLAFDTGLQLFKTLRETGMGVRQVFAVVAGGAESLPCPLVIQRETSAPCIPAPRAPKVEKP